MSLYASRRCLDIAGRIAGASNLPARTWSITSTLFVQRRCYASPAGTQQLKERPAANASASSRTSASTHQGVAKEDTVPARTSEEDLQEIEILYRMAAANQIDVSSAPLDLLDVMIPSWKSRKENPTLADHWRAFTQAQRNWFWNARSLYLMAKNDAIPGFKVQSAWSRQLFATSSTKPDTWLAPFRQAALDVYKQVNEAVAARDEKTLKTLSAGEQQKTYMKLVRSQDPRFANVWKFHGERNPAQVVSIRAIEAYYGAKPPRIGNRLAVQAVVRFDTMQSVESYSKKTGARVGTTEPKLVVEYLVFQKRMWYDSPWVIRDRLFEGLDSRFKIP